MSETETKEVVVQPEPKGIVNTWCPTQIYRFLDEVEQDILFAIYEKYGGVVNQMILDKDCIFKSHNQITVYANHYKFKEKLGELRKKRATEIVSSLKSMKELAIENAYRILHSRNVFVYNRAGKQCFDEKGEPLIIEQLPYYKEIKAAWEIIKTELGEPTTIAKTDSTVSVEPITKITFNVVNKPRVHDANIHESNSEPHAIGRESNTGERVGDGHNMAGASQ